MLCIQRSSLDAVDLMLGLHALPVLNCLDFFFWSHLKPLVNKTAVVTVQGDITAQIVGVSADVTTAPFCLNACDSPLSVVVGCAITYVATNSRNSYDNGFLLHFLPRLGMHFSYCKHYLRL
ncbi:hypothetical protein TNCV_1931111 [Trichonephila clavipes]|nr:hypothetical protein TNCV_1931111 [Trichonephila clavipes]